MICELGTATFEIVKFFMYSTKYKSLSIIFEFQCLKTVLMFSMWELTKLSTTTTCPYSFVAMSSGFNVIALNLFRSVWLTKAFIQLYWIILFGPVCNTKNGFMRSAILIIQECYLLFMQILKRGLRNLSHVSNVIGASRRVRYT